MKNTPETKPNKLPGRPTVMTDDVLRKLEEVFALGGTDTEACFYADISTTALYEYQEKTPGFTERKASLKERPVLKARQTLVKSLDQPEHAKWYLERKRKNEFSSRQEITGDNGEALNITWLSQQSPTSPDSGQSSSTTQPDAG